MRDPFESPNIEPTFPPLLRGERIASGVDPFAKALANGAAAEPGALLWSEREDRLDAAITLAPETPLGEAITVTLAVMNGLGDALGALAPPEVGVTWEWPDVVKVNGARCGVIRAGAATRDPAAVPEWLAIGVTLQIDATTDEPGLDPTTTALIEEGCAGISRTRLLESWSRHMLAWINRWLDDGFRPVHDAWVGRVEKRGETVDVVYGGKTHSGLFLGLDEQGGMLLKGVEATTALPLTAMLDSPRRWPCAPRSRS